MIDMDEYNSLRQGMRIYIDLPAIGLSTCGQVVPARMLDAGSRAKWAFYKHTGTLSVSWIPRTESEFRRRVSLERDVIDAVFK